MAKRRNSPAGIERRVVKRADTAVTSEGKITGLAAPFNSPTVIGFGPFAFREQIAPGAFKKALQEGDCVFLDNHDPARPVARQSAGSLRLRETERGLEFDADPADTTYARDLIANIQAGNIRGNSFGFECVKDAWEDGDASDLDLRTLVEVKLPEISSCTFPAYEDTNISARDAFAAAMESRSRYYGRLLRAKYSADEMDALGKKGEAYKNADGHCSYPVADADDLDNAIKAVGRGGADHDAIRKYIIGRAKALGLSEKIPDNWGSDGSLKTEQNSAGAGSETPELMDLEPEVRDLVVTTTVEDPSGDEFGDAADADEPEFGVCPQCHADNEWGFFCSQCGAELMPQSEPKFCTMCGAPVDDGERGKHLCERRTTKQGLPEPVDETTSDRAALADALRRVEFLLLSRDSE